MTSRNLCPDCGNSAALPFSHCTCGWVSESPPAALPATNDRCAHVENGIRCPLLGVVSPSTRKNGAWYCADHITFS